MTGASHVTLAVAIGKFIPNPYIAFFAGLASHLLLDKVPHFWPQARKYRAIFSTIDVVLTLSFVAFLFMFPLQNKTSLIAAAVGGIVIDFIFVQMPILIKPLYDSKPRVWHEKRQTHLRNPWFFLVDLGVIVFSLLVFFL